MSRLRSAAARLAPLEFWAITALVSAGIVFERMLPVAVASAVFFAIMGWIASPQPLATLIPPPRPFVLLLVVMLLVTLWATAFPEITRPQVWRTLAGLALYAAILRWVTASTAMLAILDRLHFLALAVSFAGLVLAMATPFIVSWQGANKLPFIPSELYLGFRLLVSDAVNSNVMAGVLVIFLPVQMALLLFRLCWSGTSRVDDGERRRFLSAGLFAFSTATLLFMLILMQSRGALFALMFSVMSLLTMRWRRMWLLFVMLLVVVLVLALTNPSVVSEALDLPTTNGALTDGAQRMEIWGRASLMIRDFPFTGIGMGAFQQVTDLLYPLLLTPSGVPHAHNLFLQIAVDLGIPGLIAWLGILVTVIIACWRAYRSSNPLLRALGAGLLASQVALVVHGLTDAVTWGMVRSAPLVWAIWGVAVACGLTAQRLDQIGAGQIETDQDRADAAEDSLAPQIS